MNNLLVVLGAVGIICSLAALMGLGMALAREGRWDMALCCLAGMATILFLLMAGIEYADEFWKGRQ